MFKSVVRRVCAAGVLFAVGAAASAQTTLATTASGKTAASKIVR